MKSVLATLALVFVVSNQASANRIISVDGIKAEKIFKAFKAAGVRAKGGNFDISGVNCTETREAQYGDPDAKPEYLTMNNCNTDTGLNIADVAATAIISSLKPAGIKLTFTSNQGDVRVRSLFLQSIGCQKKVESQSGDPGAKSESLALYTCDIEI